MAKPKQIKTEVAKKDPAAELAAINAAAGAELAAAPVTEPVVPTEAEKVDVEVEVLAAQSKAAAEANLEQLAAKAAKKVALNQQINVNPSKGSVGESAELIAAVKKDAEKRGKDFSVCPISGVLVVG